MKIGDFNLTLPPLPPAVQEVLYQVRDVARPWLDRAGPYWRVVQPYAHTLGDQISHLVQSRTLSSVGGTFRSLCIVGLNRSELLLAGEETPLFADSWQELADDSLRRGLALLFFAPRGFDGEPVNPYLFLAGEAAEPGSEAAEANTLMLAQQQLAGLPLLDLCRITPAQPNTVNMLVAADVLFHWDVKDNYVLPTTPTTWARDVESVLKSYPRTTRANLYTAWETDLLPPSDRITVRGLRELPLALTTWLNRPTFQQQYGTLMLAAGLLAAGAAWALLTWNSHRVDDLNEELRVVEQQIPQEGRLSDLERTVTEQEKMLQKRELFYLAVKDTANAVTQSAFKADNFEVKNPDADNPPGQLLVTVEAKKDAYNGWLQEEPAAKNFLMSSAMVTAVRKSPSSLYRLEGLILLDPLWRQYQKLAASVRLQRSLATSDTAPVAAKTAGGRP
jgi:hypothetical protein